MQLVHDDPSIPRVVLAGRRGETVAAVVEEARASVDQREVPATGCEPGQ